MRACLRAHTSMGACIYTHTYIYIYMYVCVCVCVCVCVHFSGLFRIRMLK